MSKDVIESEDDFDFSDDENQQNFALNKKSKKNSTHSFDHPDSESESDDQVNENDDVDQDDYFEKSKLKTADSHLNQPNSSNSDDNNITSQNLQETEKADYVLDYDDDQYFGFLSGEDEQENENTENGNPKVVKKPKVKKLTAEQLAKEEKKIKRSGVVYLSSLPPYMKPQKLRHVMSRFGEVGRIFLKPEDPKVYKSRIKSGGNKKKKFEEGWVEFASKKDAKLAAETLNGNILGGKKRSFYHDDVMNVKYLKGFKWFDLTNALNREVEVRESKKQAELSQAHKINKAFIKNVETSKTINRVKDSKKRKLEEGDKDGEERIELRRNFKQRNVVTHRADADEGIKSKTEGSKISNVLNKIF